MSISRISRMVGSAVVVAALSVGVMASTASAAPQSTKKIVCYKGKTAKTFKAAKCPTGWSPKKRVVKAGARLVAMNASYKGTIATVWSASDVKATAVTGTGTDAASGLTTITATGGSAPQAQTAPIHGSGVLKGSTGSITFVLNADAKGTAADSAAPTMVFVSGTATIKSGTGKYAGATGTLTFKGQFNVTSSAAGSKESQSFTASFTGNIKLK